MPFLAEDLAQFVGVRLSELTGDDYIDTFDQILSAFDTATVLVDDTLSSAYRPVPENIRERLVLEVGQVIFKRAHEPGGPAQGVEFNTGQAVMGPRDPLATVWPIIRRYVLPF